MTKNITEEELQALRETRNADDWSRVCNQIKTARRGAYPPDWWPKVMASGLVEEIRQSWANPDEGRLTVSYGEEAMKELQPWSGPHDGDLWTDEEHS